MLCNIGRYGKRSQYVKRIFLGIASFDSESFCQAIHAKFHVWLGFGTTC